MLHTNVCLINDGTRSIRALDVDPCQRMAVPYLALVMAQHSCLLAATLKD